MPLHIQSAAFPSSESGRNVKLAPPYHLSWTVCGVVPSCPPPLCPSGIILKDHWLCLLDIQWQKGTQGNGGPWAVADTIRGNGGQWREGRTGATQENRSLWAVGGGQLIVDIDAFNIFWKLSLSMAVVYKKFDDISTLRIILSCLQNFKDFYLYLNSVWYYKSWSNISCLSSYMVWGKSACDKAHNVQNCQSPVYGEVGADLTLLYYCCVS
jgi:hypothetical protein